MRRLMKEVGAEIVGKEALEIIRDQVEKIAKNITKSAIDIMKDDRRKKLSAKDIEIAYTESTPSFSLK